MFFSRYHTFIFLCITILKPTSTFMQGELNNIERVVQKLTHSESGKSKALTEPEASLPILQDQAIGTYREPAEITSVLIFASHLAIGLSSCLLPLGIPTKILYALIFSYLRTACSANFNLLVC
jgi:hypothetical protein